MGKTRNTGYLQNIIQYDASNNIILPGLIGTGTRMVVAASDGTLSSQTISTTNVSEGTNLYYTDARVGSYLSTNSYATQSYVTTAVSNLVNAAPATLDTLSELATALGNDANFSTTVTTALGNRLRIDVNNQSLTSTQKGYGRTNLGVVIGTDVQAWDADLDAIAALSGTSGFLKKTAANTWSLDTNTYLTSYTETDPYRVTAVAVSGTSTKTITLTRADSSTVTTTWTDYDTDTNTYVTSAAFSGGTLTLTRNDAGTVSVSLDGRYLPLAGGTLTGALSGTSATFSSWNTLGNIRLSSNPTGIEFYNTSGIVRNWQISAQNINDQSLDFTPSTANGGTTYSTPVFSLKGTNGAATFSGPTVTIGSAVAATNVKLIFNGVASKAAGIEFHQSGSPQWYIGNGIASEDNNFELYNSNGTMAMKIIKSTNAINFIGAATFSSSVTAGGSFITSAGLNTSKNIAAGEITPLHLSYSASDGVGPAARFGSGQGWWDIQPSSNNQRLSFEWQDSVNTLSLFSDGRAGINDTNPTRKFAVNFGTSVNDGLIVYGSQRQNTVFQSTGEHCFLYINSHHANTFLPVLNFQRSSTTYGSIGLNRASNSDAIGAFAESEMIVGSTTDVPFSLQTNGTRRIRMLSTGGVEIFNTLSVSGNLTARNFSKIIKSWAPAGATGSFTEVTYNWADELAALAGNFDSGCYYKGFLRSSNGAHYTGYHFDILVGSIGYGGNSLQFKVQNIVGANSPWVGGCGGSPLGTVDTTNFVHRNNPCGENLELYITRLG